MPFIASVLSPSLTVAVHKFANALSAPSPGFYSVVLSLEMWLFILDFLHRPIWQIALFSALIALTWVGEHLSSKARAAHPLVEFAPGR